MSPPSRLLGVDVRRAPWLAAPRDGLRPGEAAEEPLRVPVKVASRMLTAVLRPVADLASRGTTQVVWQLGDSELLVLLDRTRLEVVPGRVTVTLTVTCDQLDGPVEVPVPLGVGTVEAPAGLVVSGLTRLDGPAVVVDLWSEALLALAWEALVELARRLCAALGTDTAGRVLVPGSLGATGEELVVHPVARHPRRSR